MNMMRTKQFLLAAVMGLSALGFTACSDSDVAAPGVLTVDQTYVTQGVETGVESAIIEVPVTCNGRWIAVVDSCNWLAVMNEGKIIYDGNDVVKLKVDENRTGVGRKNVLSLVMLGDNDDIIKIPVYQNNLYRGEVPTNGDVATWFRNNKVGCGVNYAYLMEPSVSRSGDFDPVTFGTYNIFNMTTLENQQKTSDASYYTMARHEVTKLNEKALVNSISKSQDLNVSLEMGCSFGFIEFQAKGKYESYLTDNSDHVNYSVCRDCPVLDVTLEVPNIRTDAAANATKYIRASEKTDEIKDLWKDYNSTRSESKKAMIFNDISESSEPDLGNFFTTGFKRHYWKLFSFNYYKDDMYPNEADSTKMKKYFNQLMTRLDDDYGPFFISGGQFGGSLNLFAVVDRKNLNDSTIFGADVTANISSIFELSGHADFNSKGQQLYKNSDITMQVYGGNAAETANSVVDLLGGKDLSRTDSLAAILNKWAASFAQFDADGVTPLRAAPIMYTVTPIWSLFDDAALSSMIREWFMEAYKDRGIKTWMKIIDSTKQPQALQLLQVLAGRKDEYTEESDPSDKSDKK